MTTANALKINDPLYRSVNIMDDAYTHLTTSNLSFIKLHRTLKELGIKNNKFFLKLYDKKLMNVDPMDEDNLTSDIKARVWREIKRNPWYYLREVCRIPVSGGLKQFEIHRGNLALVWSKLNNLNQIGLLSRQNYKTVSVICADVYIYNFATTNSQIIYSNKDSIGIETNIKEFKDITNTLPSYLDTRNTKRDTDNIKYIHSSASNNSVRGAPSPGNEDNADKAGRGLTAPIIFFDELRNWLISNLSNCWDFLKTLVLVPQVQ